MSTNDRFEPVADTPYAKCTNCDFVAQDRDQARQHMDETHRSAGNNHGHRVTINNPVRPERIRSALNRLVDDALASVCEKIDDMVSEGDLTADEALAGLVFYSDFREAWQDWFENNDN